jgi:hypothetical protein
MTNTVASLVGIAAQHLRTVHGGSRWRATDVDLKALQGLLRACLDQARSVIALADHGVLEGGLGQLAVRRGRIRRGGQLVDRAPIPGIELRTRVLLGNLVAGRPEDVTDPGDTVQ